MTINEFIESVKKLGIKISDEELNKLDIYAKFLLEYNEHTNLTAIKKEEDVYLKHFYDSLTISYVINLEEEKTLLDIGTGAGFPGMILKIFFPNLKVTLLDSNNKKTKFLEKLRDKLNLNDVEIINDRVENLVKTRLNYYDVVTARAVTNMTVLTELAMPLVKEEKYFIALKGSNINEIEDSYHAISVMHGKIVKSKEFELAKEAGKRNIVKIKKLNKTNINEIRSYDKIIKKPLQKKIK